MSWTRHTSDAELVGGVGRVVQRGMEENGHGGEAVSSYIGRAKKKKRAIGGSSHVTSWERKAWPCSRPRASTEFRPSPLP